MDRKMGYGRTGLPTHLCQGGTYYSARSTMMTWLQYFTYRTPRVMRRPRSGVGALADVGLWEYRWMAGFSASQCASKDFE